jgi:hypothetical protein
MLTAATARKMIQRLLPCFTIDVKPFDRRWEATYEREGFSAWTLAYDGTLEQLVEQIRERLEKGWHTWPVPRKPIEWGIFSDKSADRSAQVAVEAGFLSPEEAEAAIEKRYPDEELTALVVELHEIIG